MSAAGDRTGQRGLLLFAHGARDPRWSVPFEDAARRVRTAAPAVPVELAFLEFMPPDLASAGTKLAGAGCTRVDIVPLFLGAGGHVRRDVPALVGALRAAHPGIDWRLHAAAGESEVVVQALAEAALARLGADAME